MIFIIYLDRLWFVTLYSVQERGEYSPGFCQLVTTDKMHLRPNKHVQDQPFICLWQPSILVPGQLGFGQTTQCSPYQCYLLLQVRSSSVSCRLNDIPGVLVITQHNMAIIRMITAQQAVTYLHINTLIRLHSDHQLIPDCASIEDITRHIFVLNPHLKNHVCFIL